MIFVNRLPSEIGKIKAVRNIACAHGVKKFSFCELAHTSFRSVRVIHRLREREDHAEKHTKDRGQSAVAGGPVAAGTGGAADRRSDEETVVACPEDWRLGCQAAARAKPIGSRPNRPNRFPSVTPNGVESLTPYPRCDRDYAAFLNCANRSASRWIGTILTPPWQLDHLPDDPLEAEFEK